MSRRHAAQPEVTYAERLGKVNGLFDSFTQARLERVARTARKLTGAEAAVIVLWRGSRLVQQVSDGDIVLPTATLLALAQDLNRGAAVHVTDLAAGPRRCIAMAPLTWDRGLSAGCLCLVDPVARELDAEALQSLDDIATWAEHELDVVRLGQALALRMA